MRWSAGRSVRSALPLRSQPASNRPRSSSRRLHMCDSSQWEPRRQPYHAECVEAGRAVGTRSATLRGNALENSAAIRLGTRWQPYRSASTPRRGEGPKPRRAEPPPGSASTCCLASQSASCPPAEWPVATTRLRSSNRSEAIRFKYNAPARTSSKEPGHPPPRSPIRRYSRLQVAAPSRVSASHRWPRCVRS
jgi:hypothetical protein